MPLPSGKSIKIGDLAKEAAVKWNGMDEETRMPFEERAAADRWGFYAVIVLPCLSLYSVQCTDSANIRLYAYIDDIQKTLQEAIRERNDDIQTSA